MVFARFSCSTALWYLLEKEEYQDYTHIWVLEDFEDNRKQIEKYEQYPNVRFVKYKSKEYCKELATVKYLVNNVSFPSYFLKREGQVPVSYTHLWKDLLYSKCKKELSGLYKRTEKNIKRNKI